MNLCRTTQRVAAPVAELNSAAPGTPARPATLMSSPVHGLPYSIVVASRIVAGQASGDWMTRRDALRVGAAVAAYIAERSAARLRGEEDVNHG